MKNKVLEMMDEQFNKEMYSAYLYLGISEFYTMRNLYGFASWYRVQAREELEHAMKFYEYLLECDREVTLKPIAAVEPNYKSILEAAEDADKHEHYITAEIEKIYAEAEAKKDYRAKLFLDWFITEQVEEENNSREVVGKIKMLGDDPRGLYMLDKEMGERK